MDAQLKEDLLEIVKSQVPLDAAEAEGLLALPHILSSDDPFNPDEMSGHVTASLIVLDPDSSAFLLIEHPKIKKWIQPGGHVDADDSSPLDAALRELKEETGLIDPEVLNQGRPIDLSVHLFPHRSDRPAHFHFDVRFVVRAKSAEIPVSPENLAVRWMPLEEVGQLGQDNLVRTISKLRSANLHGAPGAAISNPLQ
jgi:8-oxo-dGTP pyrophosphatase MutT (NUDIX family)